MGAQLRLFSQDDEAGCYHDTTRYGFFATLVLPHPTAKKKLQDCYPLAMMPTVLSRLDPKKDTWLSQAEFIKPSRRVVNLARIGLLFADLDTYRQPWMDGLSPEKIAGLVKMLCQDEGIPAPSLILFSGQGLQVKWLLNGTLPRAALPRWNACQRYLVQKFEKFGADKGAKDASRVLRLVNTVNTKSGQVCRVIDVESGPDGNPMRYDFEYMAEAILPIPRWEMDAVRQQHAERREQLKLVSGTKTGHLRGFSGRALAWHRLEDLRTLADMRGGVQDGARMKHLFWRINFLLLSGATNSSLMYHEAAALARELDPSWSYSSSELMTLYAKAKDYEAGKTVEFGGKKYPALYTPKNDRLIDYFEITDDEQRSLRTIISQDMAKERDKDRHTARRRAAGAVERSTYLDAASAKQAQAMALKGEGLSVRAIAAKMGVSVGAVSGYLKAGVQSPSVLQAGAGRFKAKE